MTETKKTKDKDKPKDIVLLGLQQLLAILPARMLEILENTPLLSAHPWKISKDGKEEEKWNSAAFHGELVQLFFAPNCRTAIQRRDIFGVEFDSQ